MSWNQPQILWPSMIAFFLLTSMALISSILYFASSDGGAQVVDNYYEKAIRWDDTKAGKQLLEELSWSFECEALSLQTRSNSLLRCKIVDGSGQSINDIKLAAEIFRPSHSAVQLVTEFMEVDSGSYEAVVNLMDQGLWDIALTGEHKGFEFNKTIRTEVK